MIAVPVPPAAPDAAAGPSSVLPPSPARVIAFIVLSLGLAALAAVPFALHLLPMEALGLYVPIAQLIPLLAVLLVRDRRVPLRPALRLVVPSSRDALLACALAVLAFSLVPLARILLGGVSGLSPFHAPTGALMLLIAVPIVLAMQTVFALGEELGWRGWLPGQLASLGFWPAAAITALLWALFHLPIVAALGFTPRESIAYLGLILVVSPLISALRELGRCVWPAVLAHGLLNSVRVAIEQNLTVGLEERTTAGFWAIELSAWTLWVLAAVLVRRLARRSRGFLAGWAPQQPTETSPGD